jgi:diguanylate cyclase (GGDEF)-like protein/putative nucleotidyltransferase with HDIG domain
VNSYALIPLTSLIVYSALIAFTLRYRRIRIHQRFIVYLLVAISWSFINIMLSTGALGLTRLWGGLQPLSTVGMAICYYYFVTAFVQKPDGIAIKLGLAVVAFVLVPLAALGRIPESVSVVDGVINVRYGALMYLLWGIGLPFFAASAYLLVRRYQALRDPLSRTRITYMLVGVSLVVVFLSRDLVPPLPKYPFDHIGQICNALLVGYAILRYQLFDIKWIMRKGVAYSAATVIITALVLFFALIPYTLTHNWGRSASIASIGGIALLVALLFNPLRAFAQKIVDRLFYGERYDYRQMVLNFSSKMSTILNLDELAEAMLPPVTKALRIKQASLLLPTDGSFISQFTQRLDAGQPVTQIKLSADNPIVTWLNREVNPLSVDRISTAPEFKALWEAEEADLNAAEVELFCPIKNKGNLVAILALSKKSQGSPYSTDDMELLMTLAGEAGAIIENAQLYAQAQIRAHVDELTGLFNHRYFHERLEEEVARCCRFGEIFSLILIDLDFFKVYNDVHGHLAGDKILKEMGEHIKGSIRNVDMAFRYGGDEFAVILPETSVDNSYQIAERIRKGMERRMDLGEASLTCSLGMASWPTHGVMKEEIIGSADAALYKAKQSGGGRICLASEPNGSPALETGVKPETQQIILSSIYALAATVDAKDHHTYGHSQKVSKYATDIAEALGFSQERINTLRTAALLHDIGKLGIPDGVLKKPGILTAEEWDPIYAHPKLGVAILKHIRDLNGCLPAVLYHHERYDGSGYCSGLKGANIPLDARILSVADAYDAMTSVRPYRERALTHQQAVEELRLGADKQFDPEIVEVFIALHEQASLKPGSPIAKWGRRDLLVATTQKV